MADQSSTPLLASRREPSGSRSARRLRREGAVPGIVYGGGEEPLPFSVNARDLRRALADTGAVLDLQLDGAGGTPVVLKEIIRHPVSGETTHVDLIRVNLNVAIQAQVPIELIGGEDAPGVKVGGVMEQPTREVTVEALPTTIPDVIQHDVSAMKVGDTLMLSALVPPAGVTILGEGDTLVAAVTQSRASRSEFDPEIETETEIVGEAEAAAEAKAEADDAGAGASGGVSD